MTSGLNSSASMPAATPMKYKQFMGGGGGAGGGGN